MARGQANKPSTIRSNARSSDARKRHRQQSGARPGAHRGQVTEIDGQRTMSGVGRDEAAIEVDTLDLRIGSQHFERASHRFDRSGIVSRANDHPGLTWDRRSGVRCER